MQEGLGLQVAEALLGSAEGVVLARQVVDRSDLLAVPDLPQTSFTKPADWAHRVTLEDIRREIRDEMISRAPEWEDLIWLWAASRMDEIPDAMLSPLGALERKCAAEVYATVPKVAGKRKPVTRMPVRKEGPCSLVVTKTKDGSLYCMGRKLTKAEAAEVLATPVEPTKSK